MTYALYDGSIELAKAALESLKAILQKGEASPNADKLPEARIHPDMLPLSFQVHLTTDLAQKLVARTTGAEPLTYENNLKTFAEFYSRIDEVQAILAKADKDVVNKRSGEVVPLGMGGGKTIHLPSASYVTAYLVPNLFFHVTTAYDIMRKEGVPVGKMDFLTPFVKDHLPTQ